MRLLRSSNRQEAPTGWAQPKQRSNSSLAVCYLGNYVSHLLLYLLNAAKHKRHVRPQTIQHGQRLTALNENILVKLCVDSVENRPVLALEALTVSSGLLLCLFFLQLTMKMFSPAECVEFLEASDKPRPLVIRANTLKTRRKDLAEVSQSHFEENTACHPLWLPSVPLFAPTHQVFVRIVFSIIFQCLRSLVSHETLSGPTILLYR